MGGAWDSAKSSRCRHQTVCVSADTLHSMRPSATVRTAHQTLCASPRTVSGSEAVSTDAHVSTDTQPLRGEPAPTQNGATLTESRAEQFIAGSPMLIDTLS
jgi:hypothetical protein